MPEEHDDTKIHFQSVRMTQREYDELMKLSMSFHAMEESHFELSTGVDKFWEQLTLMLETAIIVEEVDMERLED